MNVRLRFLSGPFEDQSLDIAETVVLGRQPAFGLALPDPAVSSEHCRIVLRDDGAVILEDLDSTNGTELNGNPLSVPSALVSGSEIQVGDTRIIVEFSETEHAPPVTASTPPQPATPPCHSDPTPCHSELAEESQAPAPPFQGAPTNPEPACSPRRSPFKLHRSAVILSVLALALALAGVYLRGCGVGESARNMLDPSAQRAALRQFRREGVALTIHEPAGLDRIAEPVTSGVPLPEGVVTDPTRLVLANAAGQPVPCQTVVQSRWPDGSAKWVLLDFQATVASNATANYTLSPDGPASSPPERPVTIVRETDTTLVLDNGRLTLTFDKTRPGLIRTITLDGEPVVATARPVGTTLVNKDDTVYHASAPDRFEIEHRGPMRTVVRIGGHYVSESGQTIHDGKVGYDLRVTVYADKPWIGLDFTLRNDGWFGYRNESQHRLRRPRQWLYIKSLSLDVPVVVASGTGLEADLSGRQLTLAAGEEADMVQWYLSPPKNARHQRGIFTEFGKANLAPHALAADMAQRYRGFYGAWTVNGKLTGEQGRMEGQAVLTQPGRSALRLSVRRFWQNHPRGFAVARDDSGRLAIFSLLMLPEGGRWPETLEAFQAGTYQFEGGRRKTVSARLDFNGGDSPSRRMDAPLLAVAPVSWYRDTGSVFPLAEAEQEPGIQDDRLADAFKRYDRTQRAKVVREAGDPAGRYGPLKESRYDRVSIPWLWERHPEVFTGWMNYGDLVWDFGYCSLHYDWPYSMLVHYIRLGDRAFLDVAEDMARHRYDIDQYHVEDTATWLGGFQRYEKGEHGHTERLISHNVKLEMNATPSHTWNRGLLLHWALTGDPRSLDAAEQNGRAYRRFFYDQHKLHEKETLPWGQIRVPGWAIENWLALYEYTGQSEYLDWASELFDKSPLAMEQKNGGVGHILPKGHQDAQQTSYILEPVIRLHHHTGRDDILGFLQRILDWHREAGMARGIEKDGVYWPLLWREQWTGKELTLEETPMFDWSQTFSWLFADGYAYLYHVLGREKDIETARRAFADTALYFGIQRVTDPASRHALGYHWAGSPLTGYSSKIQGLNGRYGLLYLHRDAAEQGP